MSPAGCPGAETCLSRPKVGEKEETQGGGGIDTQRGGDRDKRVHPSPQPSRIPWPPNTAEPHYSCHLKTPGPHPGLSQVQQTLSDYSRQDDTVQRGGHQFQHWVRFNRWGCHLTPACTPSRHLRSHPTPVPETCNLLGIMVPPTSTRAWVGSWVGSPPSS